jgi:asparagine synthase (glutamine-hydrolysing)
MMLGCAVLGHRRLSIIDLSDAGRQPMSNEDGRVWITFNGEIYNYQELYAPLVRAGHRFTSQTDTETLIHGYEEWGIDGLLKRCCGMYAFALLDLQDSEHPRMLLVRDRLGIKPLYYAIAADGTLYFASEVRAIRRHAPVAAELDPDAMLGYLALGSVPGPATIFKNIQSVPPAHYLEVTRKRVGRQPYWDLHHCMFGSGSQDGKSLKNELEQAVRQHLISDVPLGIFLSGGVDSAGLVALAQRAQTSQVKTLTVTFDEAEYDESPVARKVAQAFGTEHHEINVTGAEFLVTVPRILSAIDQPGHDGVNTYFVSAAARKAGLKVVLSGLGGDEVFWGYPHYHQLGRPESQWQRVLQGPAILRRVLAFTGSTYGQLRGKENLRRLDYLRNGMTASRVYLAARGFFPPAQIQKLLGLDSSEMRRRTARLLEMLDEASLQISPSAPEAFNYIEMRRYLHDQLLRDTDVFSMAHSIEARVPYLDHRIVEIAVAAASSRKLSTQSNKPMLVEAINSEVVTELSRAPKRGFTFPFQQWMRRHAGELGPLAERTGCLDRRSVRELWEQQRTGRLHWSRAWSTVALAAATEAA